MVLVSGSRNRAKSPQLLQMQCEVGQARPNVAKASDARDSSAGLTPTNKERTKTLEK